MTRSPSEVWSRYWSSGARGTGGGCLPNAVGPVEAAQRQVWQDFARRLPSGSRVLDLGTGNGIVLRWMAAVRRDLKLVGVDSAASLPPAPKGVTLKAGVGVERLPFAEASFGGATSQFGIEYGDVAAAGAELVRILRPGAPLLMIVHHGASWIVAHNRARRAALLWAAGPDGWLVRAKAFACAGGALPVPASFRAAPAEAQRRFPDQPVAAEFAVGIVQRLELVRSRGGTEVVGLLEAMAEEADGEIARIALLEDAARDEAGAAALVETLAAAGLAMDAPSVLPDRQAGRPLAWLLSGRASGPGTSR